MSQQIYHKKLPFVSRTIVRKIKRPKFNNLLNNFLSPFFRLQVSLRRSLFRRRKPPMSSLGNLKKWKLNEKIHQKNSLFLFRQIFYSRASPFRELASRHDDPDSSCRSLVLDLDDALDRRPARWSTFCHWIPTDGRWVIPSGLFNPDSQWHLYLKFDTFYTNWKLEIWYQIKWLFLLT